MNFKKFSKKPKAKKKKPDNDARRKMIRRQLVIGFLITLFIGLLGTGIYYFTRIDSLQVTDVKIIGGKTIPHSEVEKLTREAFSGTYFKLVPYSFKPTFPQDAVVQNIKTIDRVKNVQLDFDKRKTLVVVYDEYLPVALWCENETDEECLFLDKNGYAFADAPDLRGGAFVRIIDNGVKPEKRTAAFAADFVQDNQDFVERLKDELGLYVTHIEKMEDYDIEYTVSGGGKIKTSQTMDIDKTFTNLRTILQSEDFAHIKSGEFQYIDLRFGDKVFVNEEMDTPEVATSTASTTE